jgi:hypothetical protein
MAKAQIVGSGWAFLVSGKDTENGTSIPDSRQDEPPSYVLSVSVPGAPAPDVGPTLRVGPPW